MRLDDMVLVQHEHGMNLTEGLALRKSDVTAVVRFRRRAGCRERSLSS